MTVALRKAGPGDREFAYEVRRTAFRRYVEKVEGWDDARERRRHAQRFEAQDFRVVTVDGADVGIVALVVAPDCVKLNQMFILPAHQGREIGRRCMVLVLEEARGLGRPVRLRVLKINPWARAFYERLGFRRTGETDTHDLLERA